MTDEQCVALMAAIIYHSRESLMFDAKYAPQQAAKDANDLFTAVRRVRAAQFNGANDPKEA